MTEQSFAPAPAVPSEYQHRGWILAVMCTALVMVVAGVSMLANAMPSIAASLDASQSSQQWIVDAYALVLAALLLPAGAMGDRFGRRGALIAGTAIFGIGSLLSAFVELGRTAHRAARAHRPGRRAPHARHAVHDHQRVPAGGAGQGSRHLGRLRRRRRHARHPRVGRAARAVLVGLDLPRHRGARGLVVHRRDRGRARARAPRSTSASTRAARWCRPSGSACSSSASSKAPNAVGRTRSRSSA